MSNRKKRVAACLLSACLLAGGCLLTAAEPAAETTDSSGIAETAETAESTAPTADSASPRFITEKVWTLSVLHGSGLLSESPTNPSFWEYPTLTAGETAPEGHLTIVNNTPYEASVVLKGVELPYENTAALLYLNALHLTVSEGDAVLYDGAYARVVDTENGLQLPDIRLQSGESKTYTIRLRCAFDYEAAEHNSERIHWQFSSIVSYTQPVTEPDRSFIWWMLGAVGVLMVVAAVLGIVRARQRRRLQETRSDGEN